MRVEHEYERGGALAYIAAWDVHRAKIFGRCEPTTGIAPFGRLVDEVMSQPPYCSARRVFWIVDNGSSHRGQPAVARLQERWPGHVLVHTPVHASWLNQIEIYFSIIQRKVLTPNDFRAPRSRSPPRLSSALRADRQAIPMDLHPPRSASPLGQARAPAAEPGRVNDDHEYVTVIASGRMKGL